MTQIETQLTRLRLQGMAQSWKNMMETLVEYKNYHSQMV